MNRAFGHSDAVAKLKLETRAFIDGAYVPSASGRTFETLNPANGKLITQVAAGDEEDVNRAVAASRRSFASGVWSKLAPRERKKVLLRLADLVEKHKEELALIEVLDCGKPISDARAVDLPDSIETLRWHAELADKLHDQTTQTPTNIVSMIAREPIGVVGAVIPWNFPLFVAMWKLAPALAGGNSIIVKPAELTSLSLIRMAELASEAGIPDGVFNVVPGLGHEAGKAIGLHMDIDCVSFTGSGEVGRYFLEYSAKSNLKKVVLECGGKSPAIVMRDAKNLESIAQNLAVGILFCQGENCSAGSRLIVDEPIREQLMEVLKTEFGTWKVGDPFAEDTRMGAMIEENHLGKVTGLIAQGTAEGGKITLGGKRILEETGGYFVDCFSEGDFALPFGGFKESGFGGKDKGLAAHDQYLESKSIWIQLSEK
ncbi:aldehyde dehydrogenase family protein [Mesorhizobium sp. 2RAF21]|uniref:aldehyde dehydrogenase family protein n=1 Tax=Mesorhizobium sp. 2RAF21 TaxID=3232995 RepID=UPI003F9496C9